jgi:hypothetical protein
MGDDKAFDGYASDNEESPTKRDDDRDAVSMPTNVSPARPLPHGLTLPTPGTDQGPSAHLPTPTFLGELPHRPPYATAMLHSDLHSDSAAYMTTGGLGIGVQTPLQSHSNGLPMQEMLANPHEAARRPSLYPNHGTSDFNSPVGHAMYQAWQQGTSTANNHGPMYAFTPQQHAQQQMMAQTPPFMSNTHFDGMPRSGFDTDPVFRTAAVPTTPLSAQGLFQVHPVDNRSPISAGVKVDPSGRGRMH